MSERPNSQQQDSNHVVFEATKKAGSLANTVLKEAATQMIHGPQAGQYTVKKANKGKYPTYQDHGVYCKICQRKRWCRVS